MNGGICTSYIYFGSECLISRLVVIIWINQLLNESQIKLNFASIFVGILHLVWLTMATISLRCCGVKLVFSYIEFDISFSRQYSSASTCKMFAQQWQHESSKPLVLLLLYYTRCKLFVILILKYCLINKTTICYVICWCKQIQY